MRGRYERHTWQYDPSLYAPARYRRACRYEAFIPEPLQGYQPTLHPDTVGTVSDAERALVAVGTDAREALAPLGRLLLRTESIASSKVEGLQMDARDLARGEARAETGGKVGPTLAEILANIDAMELAIDETAAASHLDIERIVAIHRRLMEVAPNARVAGRIRDEQNWIGGNDFNPCGADFVPPPPEQVVPLLDDLCAWAGAESLPPLVQAALVHAQFETIHPFDDGNGRTGRTLIHVVLRRRALTPGFVPPISVLFAQDRESYTAGLTAYRHGEVDRWVSAFCVAAHRAADLAAAYLRAVDQLTARWRQMLTGAADPRSDAAAWAVIDVLPAHPVITSAVARTATGRAKAAVHAALDQLEDAGILVQVSGGRRNRAWEADGLLDLVAGLERGEMPQVPG